MIIREGTEIARLVVVKTPEGNTVSRIKEFDTITKKAIMYATIHYSNNCNKVAMLGESLMNGGRKIGTFECHLLEHTAYNTITGEVIK